MKKLSIIVPVYNTEKYLKKCFESIIAQNSKDIEAVIINDGSTDNSESIIEEYINKYPEIFTYYKKENSGVADTRNYGIEKANAKYIMFLDSDDYIDAKLYENIEKYINEDIDLIKYKLQRVDENGKLLEITEGATFEKTSGQDGFNRLYDNDKLLDSPCVYIVKKVLFTKSNLKFMLGTEHEDFGLIPFVIVNADSMVSINFYGYYYVQSSGSITRNEDYKKTIKKAYDALKHYDNAVELVDKLNISKLTKENVKIYYTNAIILKANELKQEEQEKYIKELKTRKVQKNIKPRNLKQLIKRILLSINIKTYLKMR